MTDRLTDATQPDAPELAAAEATLENLETLETRRHDTYPAYRPSGIEWLGDVPEHWDTPQLRRLFRSANGATPSSGEESYWDGDIVWITPDDLGSFKRPEIGDSRRRISEAGYLSCGTTLVPAGSLVVSTRAPIGYIGIAEVSLCTNQGCKSLVPTSELDTKYHYYQLLAAEAELKSRGRGSTFAELSRTELMSVMVASPPLEEQRKIARFLDERTAKIDDLISAKHDLLALLKEKRQAVITHAVTKGLDFAANTRPSGIEWLGDVPEHWKPKKLGYLVDMRGGATPNKANDEYWRGHIPWISPKDMKSLVIRDSQDHISESALSETNLGLIAPSSVLMVVRGMILAHSFPVGITTMPATINQDMKALIPRNEVSSEFLLHLLNGVRKIILGVVDDSAHGTRVLRIAQWKNITVYIPEKQEQDMICDFVDDINEKYDEIISEAQIAIRRLREYRTSLISAAVTGKIDVRGDAG